MAKKLNVGDIVGKRDLQTIDDNVVTIPDAKKLIHLQFRRFAGCPFCNLHLRSISVRYDELVNAGVQEVVVFYSAVEPMRKFQGERPFPVIADPNKTLYAEFGVESSLKAVLNPRSILFGLKDGIHRIKLTAPEKGESPLGLPADFLIAPNGSVVACHYGSYSYDQWGVDDILGLARRYMSADNSISS